VGRRVWMFVFGMLLAILLAGCSDGPPSSTLNPLVYPGVTKVEERTLGEADVVLHIYKSAEFTTTDTPETVLKWYREQLETDGWKADEFQPDPRALMLRWESFEQPPTAYWCEVIVRDGDGGVTNVRVDLRDSAGN
jgi:hypothetical protein